jgi:hypothetical protein
MFGRSVSSLIAFVGGALVLLGAMVAFLLSLVNSPTSGAALVESTLALLIALVLGVLVFVVARPRLFWWGTGRMVSGFLLLILGALVWFLYGSQILVVVGAVLVLIAGALLLIQGIAFGTLSFGRRLFRRRLF